MIDAHVHLWQCGAHGCVWPTAADGAIFRDFHLGDLVRVLDAAGIARALLVQSQESARDTAWLLDVAAASPRLAGVVGWADCADAADIVALAASPGLKGLRPMVQDKAAVWFDATAQDAAFAAMARHGLVLDALVRPRHLSSLHRLAVRHPDLRIVIDHAAKPEGEAGLPAWRDALAPLADRPAVHVKLSGLLGEVPPHAIPAVVTTLRALFGADRLLWGSDWPVVTAHAGHADWLALARMLIPADERAAVFGGNAARVYRLDSADA